MPWEVVMPVVSVGSLRVSAASSHVASRCRLGCRPKQSPTPSAHNCGSGCFPEYLRRSLVIPSTRRVRSTGFVGIQRTDRAPLNTRYARHNDMCRPGQLLTELRERNSRGTAHARRALEDIAAGCRSAPECELRDLIRGSRVLPEPRWNEPLPGDPRPIPDVCWPEARRVVEVDSRSWHGFGNAPEHTERRRALLA